MLSSFDILVIWQLSTWGLLKGEVDAVGARLKSIVYNLFPQQTDEPKAACALPEAEPAPT